MKGHGPVRGHGPVKGHGPAAALPGPSPCRFREFECRGSGPSLPGFPDGPRGAVAAGAVSPGVAAPSCPRPAGAVPSGSTASGRAGPAAGCGGRECSAVVLGTSLQGPLTAVSYVSVPSFLPEHLWFSSPEILFILPQI